MTPTGRVLLYNDEAHFDHRGTLAVGDTFPVIRGNGPREGDRMGTATVTSIDEHGEPTLEIRFGGQEEQS